MMMNRSYINPESRLTVPVGGRKRVGSDFQVAKGYSGAYKNVVGLEYGHGCTTPWIHWSTLNSTLHEWIWWYVNYVSIKLFKLPPVNIRWMDFIFQWYWTEGYGPLFVENLSKINNQRIYTINIDGGCICGLHGVNWELITGSHWVRPLSLRHQVDSDISCARHIPQDLVESEEVSVLLEAARLQGVVLGSTRVDPSVPCPGSVGWAGGSQYKCDIVADLYIEKEKHGILSKLEHWNEIIRVNVSKCFNF